MQTLKVTHSGPKLTPKRLQAFEEQLGSELPKDYREFLLNHNGGTPSKACFCAKAIADDPMWIDFFHFIDENLAQPRQHAHPESVSYIHFVYGRFIPNDSLIIGKVCRDDLLLLRIRGKHRGRVDLKSMYRFGMPDKDWEADKEHEVQPVAKSFSKFLQMLTVCE